MGGSRTGQGFDFSQLFGGGEVPGFPVPQNGVANPGMMGGGAPEEEPWDDQIVASTPTPDPGGRHHRRNRRVHRRQRNRQLGGYSGGPDGYGGGR